jgi:hypothetical protein
MSAGRLPSASALLRKAEEATGLTDWGGDLFRQPFAVLIDDLNSTAELHELGARRAERRLLDTLCMRLRLVADRTRFPGIAAEQIERPIFVIGLPRSGTTFFHNLLSADPANRSPATWEIMYPSPPPAEATYCTDPRIGEAEAAMAETGFMAEDLQAIHPFDASRPEECNFIWELSFLTVNYMAWWNVPNYRKLLYSTDFREVYQEHRQVLQHLQHRYRRDRWVLKTPAHMAWLEHLFAVYPDACLVQCHRDPAKIIPSLSNNLAVWRRTFSDTVPAGDFGMLELQAEGLANVARFRAQPRFRDRFFDAHYLDVQADPIAMLKRAYDTFDVGFDDEREATIRAWMRQDREAHAKGARHAYRLDDYGLDYAAIDRVMGGYIRDFNVQLER